MIKKKAASRIHLPIMELYQVLEQLFAVIFFPVVVTLVKRDDESFV